MALSLEAYRLACGYPGRRILDAIDFAVEGGQVVGLVGANGSGKTTLIKSLVGLIAPLEGRVLVSGDDTRTMGPRERARLIGYVPQAARPAFPYRVEDFVVMGRAPHIEATGRPRARDLAAAAAALADLGITELAGQSVTRLSGGQLQLVLIARALAQEPRVLILDEPASSLDFGHQMRLLTLLRALAGRGIAVFMSTHHPDHVLGGCDRVVLLAGGRLLAQGPPAEALTEAHLTTIYGVPVAVVAVTLPSGEIRRICVPRAG